MIWKVDSIGNRHKEDYDCDAIAYHDDDKFFVLASKTGDLFNPQNRINPKKKDVERGGLLYELKRCPLNCYVSYVNFLRTRNNALYELAQRRFLNESR